MSEYRMAKTSAVIFGTMLLLVVFQSIGIAQLDLPYVVRAVMVVTGGATLGLAASLIWIRSLLDNHFWVE